MQPMLRAALVSAAVVFLAALSCSDEADEPTPTPPTDVDVLAVQMSSTAFNEGAPIPSRYTCDGDNLSPPLAWKGIPASAASLALVADDPDAGGTWVHWVLYGLPADARELPEGVPATEATTLGAGQGVNDFNDVGYGGPCPPGGSPHRYFFKLYALDVALGLEAGSKKRGLLEAMEGHIVAEGQLMGTYQRR